jgi:hypothetical protein
MSEEIVRFEIVDKTPYGFSYKVHEGFIEFKVLKASIYDTNLFAMLDSSGDYVSDISEAYMLILGTGSTSKGKIRMDLHPTSEGYLDIIPDIIRIVTKDCIDLLQGKQILAFSYEKIEVEDG